MLKWINLLKKMPKVEADSVSITFPRAQDRNVLDPLSSSSFQGFNYHIFPVSLSKYKQKNTVAILEVTN